MFFLTANKINKPKSTQAEMEGTLDTTKQPNQQHKLEVKKQKNSPQNTIPTGHKQTKVESTPIQTLIK